MTNLKPLEAVSVVRNCTNSFGLFHFSSHKERARAPQLSSVLVKLRAGSPPKSIRIKSFDARVLKVQINGGFDSCFVQEGNNSMVFSLLQNVTVNLGSAGGSKFRLIPPEGYFFPSESSWSQNFITRLFFSS